MSDNEHSRPAENEWVHGYEIKRSIVFENNRGFALAENPDAVQPFVTWQFTEGENGKRDFYWGYPNKNKIQTITDMHSNLRHIITKGLDIILTS